ncbi:MAG: AsnC family transcriptional regulator [Nocardia sp.]|nr:AsnC family transcriptional regulator [Nocardia sp.]
MTPESSTGTHSVQDSYFEEADLALIDALQAAPRAAWSQIGPALGMDATTAARRWERLRANGLAWVTAYDSARTTTIAFVDIRCLPQHLDAVQAAATALPWVYSVDAITGDFDLMLSVASADLPTLDRWLRRGIGSLPGVRSTRTTVGITLYGEGSEWSIRAMQRVRRAELSMPRPPGRTSYSTVEHNRLAPPDQALVDALGADGRLGFTALADATGISEHTARRRLHRMIREGQVTLRCDLAYPIAGLPTLAVYRMSVPHNALEVTGSELARLDNVRMCAAVSGPHNLLVQVLLHGLHGLDAFDTVLAERFPALRVKDRTLVMYSAKRIGWLLDRRGRAIGRVPLGPGDYTPATR